MARTCSSGPATARTLKGGSALTCSDTTNRTGKPLTSHQGSPPRTDPLRSARKLRAIDTSLVHIVLAFAMVMREKPGSMRGGVVMRRWFFAFVQVVTAAVVLVAGKS